MRLWRPARLSLAALAVVALWPIAAYAEAPGGDGGTVNVGPVSNGPVVSQGSAGYDPTGINATAATRPSGSGTTPNSLPDYTYRPVPYNSVPAPIQNNNGTLSNPNVGLSLPACPAGQTGYFVYDSNGNSLGIVCVPNPTASLLPPTTPDIALADQASSKQPWPTLVMGINPGTGLTGLPSSSCLCPATPPPPAPPPPPRPLTLRPPARLAAG